MQNNCKNYFYKINLINFWLNSIFFVILHRNSEGSHGDCDKTPAAFVRPQTQKDNRIDNSSHKDQLIVSLTILLLH